MPDRFSQPVKDTLARRVADRCSNPSCGAVTSGPGVQPDIAINVGVAAHITAASPGGPRYDPSLTPQERASARNGIWLCQTCAHLIDSDEDAYSVELLQRWKAEAEARASTMLEHGIGSVADSLELSLPTQHASDSLLSFANPAITRVGRDEELAELRAFLEADTPFAWWLWTGAAGVGKSRLAIEQCRQVASTWKAGFLPEPSQSALAELQPAVPTLVVIDYAAQRAAWLSDTLLRLSQRERGVPVRVLVLERSATGTWWNTVQRLQRMEESFEVLATMHGLPRPLTGLSRDELRTLIREVAKQVGTELTSTNVENIADHAAEIDPDGRPLFALIATFDWLDDAGVSAGRDAALRRLLVRMEGQTEERLAGRPAAAPLVRNLRTLATALGGLSVDGYVRLLAALRPRTELLPQLTGDAQGLLLDELLEGVRPDILGELYVLDRLAAGGVERAIVREMLGVAWRASEDAYHAFVERTARDHSEHDRLVDLLDVEGWQESPIATAVLAVDAVPLLGRSDHPALEWTFSRLAALQEASDEPALNELAAILRFRFANLFFGEGDVRRANELFTEALAYADPAWPVYADILNNRGITWLMLDDRDDGRADFTSVIELDVATNEARACALNNRADMYSEDGDLASSVADRTEVLALADTTYDRRFIALARRAQTLWRLGQHDAAYDDIERILTTPDIAVEQKMNARLVRARWLTDTGRSADARRDLDVVVASPRNFDEVERSAREMISGLQG